LGNPTQKVLDVHTTSAPSSS